MYTHFELQTTASSDLMQLILHCYAQYGIFKSEIISFAHVMQRGISQHRDYARHYIDMLKTPDHTQYAALMIAREMRHITWDGSLDRHGLFSPLRVIQRLETNMQLLGKK